MNFKMLQFFQNLNKNIISIISWCRISFKFFIFIIIIIYLIYNIGFISYMEENVNCFEECSLEEEDILLKDINNLKDLKIEELSIEEKNENNLVDKDCNLSISQKIRGVTNFLIFIMLSNTIFPFLQILFNNKCKWYDFHEYVFKFKKKYLIFSIILLILQKILLLCVYIFSSGGSF